MRARGGLNRRRKWSLQVGLFLLYVLVQLVTSATTNKTIPVTTGEPLKESATKEPELPVTTKAGPESQKDSKVTTQPTTQTKTNPPDENNAESTTTSVQSFSFCTLTLEESKFFYYLGGPIGKFVHSCFKLLLLQFEVINWNFKIRKICPLGSFSVQHFEKC